MYVVWEGKLATYTVIKRLTAINCSLFEIYMKVVIHMIQMVVNAEDKTEGNKYYSGISWIIAASKQIEDSKTGNESR